MTFSFSTTRQFDGLLSDGRTEGAFLTRLENALVAKFGSAPRIGVADASWIEATATTHLRVALEGDAPLPDVKVHYDIARDGDRARVHLEFPPVA